jgi:membrane protease YdiL (CAAX protease family)
VIDRREKARSSRLLFGLEILAVAAVFAADAQHLIVFSKTPYLLVLAWASLAARGIGWRDLGFRRTPNARRLVFVGLAAGLAMEGLELFVTQPALTALTHQSPDLSDAAALAANWKLFLLALALTWSLAAFGEELVWRGYVLNRLENLFGRSSLGMAGALLISSLVFGAAHAPQGVTGVIENALDGLLLGALYLATHRNLIAPIVAHGVTDTVDFTLIFTHHYPGM